MVRKLLAPAIDCTRESAILDKPAARLSANAIFILVTIRVPRGVTGKPVAFSSSVDVAAYSSFEDLWDIAAVLEALHLGALWRFGDHLRRDQPME